MTIRFFFQGSELTGSLTDTDYRRPWFVHVAAMTPRRFETTGARNLSDAILAARDLAPQDVWISTEDTPPESGWPT